MIQRYDVDYCTQHACTCKVVKDDEGGYVEYEDYAALEAKYSEVKSRVELEAKHSEVKTYAVNCNDAWLNTKGDDTSGSYVKFADYAALEAKYSEAQRELVALRSQVRDASALVKQLHDVVATIVVDVDAPKEEAWTVWSGGDNPVPGKMVEFKMRNGERGNDQIHSSVLHWDHHGEAWDVIAYRVVKEG